MLKKQHEVETKPRDVGSKTQKTKKERRQLHIFIFPSNARYAKPNIENQSVEHRRIP